MIKVMSELLGITGAIGSGKTTFAAYLGDAVEDHAHYETWQVVAQIASTFNQALLAELAYETTESDLELANQVLIWLPDAISENLHHDVVWNQLAITAHDTRSHPEQHHKLFDYIKMARKNPAILSVQLTTENKDLYRPILQWLGSYLVVKLSKTIWYDELLRRIQLRNPTTSLVTIGGVRYASDAASVRQAGGKIIKVSRPGEAKSNDITGSELAIITPDITVKNDGTLAQLETLAETLVNDLASGNPQKIYNAANF